jgi:hypothetical protein
MEEFTAPDSDKFIFLLSTRAGGLRYFMNLISRFSCLLIKC